MKFKTAIATILICSSTTAVADPVKSYLITPQRNKQFISLLYGRSFMAGSSFHSMRLSFESYRWRNCVMGERKVRYADFGFTASYKNNNTWKAGLLFSYSNPLTVALNRHIVFRLNPGLELSRSGVSSQNGWYLSPLAGLNMFRHTYTTFSVRGGLSYCYNIPLTDKEQFYRGHAFALQLGIAFNAR